MLALHMCASESLKVAFVVPQLPFDLSSTQGITKLNWAFLAELLALRPEHARENLTTSSRSVRTGTIRGSRIYAGGILNHGRSVAFANPVPSTSSAPPELDSSRKGSRIASQSSASASPASSPPPLHQHAGAAPASPALELQERVRALEAELSASKAREAEAQAQTQSLQAELANLRTENATLRQQLEESNKVTASRDAAVAAAAPVASEAPASVAAPAPAGAESASSREELEKELEKAKAMILELEQRVTERSNLLAALDALEARFDEVSKSKEALAARVKELEHDNKKLKKKKKGDEKEKDREMEPVQQQQPQQQQQQQQDAISHHIDLLTARNAELGSFFSQSLVPAGVLMLLLLLQSKG